jgi:uncharacterized protein
MGNINNSINYIELPMVKNAETKKFYHQAFGWEFTDWGPDYISFAGTNIDGGFNGMEDAEISNPGVLVVLYASDLDKKLEEVIQAGAKIIKPTYEFPGGRRFHFIDPNVNELAI